MRTRFLLLLSIVMILVLAAGCVQAPTQTSAAPAPTLDVSSFTNAVLAKVKTQLSQQEAVQIDEATIRQLVQAEIASNAADTLDTAAVQRMVDQAVARKLAEQSNTVAVSAPLAGSAADLQSTLIALYQQVNPAVVYILTTQGSGSGFVYDTQGHIVTNRHVAANSNQFEVVFANGDRQSARLVGEDADSDLAVLQVDSLPDGVQPLPLAEGDVQVGQLVIAIGNPFGEQGSLSLGVVSGLGRSLRSQRSTVNTGLAYSLPSVIQTDAPINPGNSGGPLLNLAGQVVGVNSAIASTSGVNSGVGFSVPVIAVRQFVPDLISQGSHRYSYLGASFDDEIDLSDQQIYGVDRTSGAYLVSVSPNGPAALAGLRGADPNTGRGGDLVIAIDGRPVDNFGDLNSYLVFSTQPDQQIEMTVVRNGEEISVPVTLGERP